MTVLTSTPSFATCNFQTISGKEQIMNISLPSTITLPRNTAPGTTIFESATFQHGRTTDFSCTSTAPYGPYNDLGSTTVGSTLFPIGNTGLSWQYMRGNPDLKPSKGFGSSNLNPVIPYSISSTTSSMRIIATGTIVNGATIPAGNFGSLMADNIKLATFRSTSITTFVSSSCETPNINVKMGQHRFTDIPEDGSPSKKAISFNLKLNNCPAGIKNVSYTLTPTSSSPSQNDSQGIINLNQNSTAKGIGLQITDGNLAPIALNEAKPFNEYSNKGGNFTIPLNAYYVRILKGASLTPGTANAEITFTMSYQ